jgi:hypothetical protein
MLKKQTIAILGATGSIGKQVKAVLGDEYQVKLVSANVNGLTLADEYFNYGSPLKIVGNVSYPISAADINSHVFSTKCLSDPKTYAGIDVVVNGVYENIENLSNEDLRGFIMKVSLKSYSFSGIKEKAAFKSELSETLRKEAHALAFGSAEGTATAKENQAVLNTSSEILAEEIYTLVAGMLKTKLDEIHRVVNTLQTVLMTRMQEAKLTSIDIQ